MDKKTPLSKVSSLNVSKQVFGIQHESKADNKSENYCSFSEVSNESSIGALTMSKRLKNKFSKDCIFKAMLLEKLVPQERSATIYEESRDSYKHKKNYDRALFLGSRQDLISNVRITLIYVC